MRKSKVASQDLRTSAWPATITLLREANWSDETGDEGAEAGPRGRKPLFGKKPPLLGGVATVRDPRLPFVLPFCSEAGQQRRQRKTSKRLSGAVRLCRCLRSRRCGGRGGAVVRDGFAAATSASISRRDEVRRGVVRHVADRRAGRRASRPDLALERARMEVRPHDVVGVARDDHGRGPDCAVAAACRGDEGVEPADILGVGAELLGRSTSGMRERSM